MRKVIVLISCLPLLHEAGAFLSSNDPSMSPHNFHPLYLSSKVDVETEVETEEEQKLRSSVASKFNILTCTSTACAKKRQSLNMDEFATFGAMYSRAQNGAPEMQVEESPCLGSCKKAPCVAIEHDDYIGTVALEGMTQDEFSASCFHNIITEEDADRIWSSVTNAVDLMMEEEEDDEQD